MFKDITTDLDINFVSMLKCSSAWKEEEVFSFLMQFFAAVLHLPTKKDDFVNVCFLWLQEVFHVTRSKMKVSLSMLLNALPYTVAY